MKIIVYVSSYKNKVLHFFEKVFYENNRKLDLSGKDLDLVSIEESYMMQGKFWLLVDSNDNVHGTIAIRKIQDFFEIRRFFVDKANKHYKYGEKLLYTALDYAMANKIKVVKAATMKESNEARHLFQKYGFKKCCRYNNSSADLFFELLLNIQTEYQIRLDYLREKNNQSLILNPTENLPFEVYNSVSSNFLEGLYISERHKDVNDKVIFGGRNEYIDFVGFIKNMWIQRLHATDVDLKPLSGLNAHLILFLCILKPDEKVMILPEICGGHFATQAILNHIGVQPFEMIADYEKMCVDKKATLKLIEKKCIDYVFVDRSEGLYYEDFSWLSDCNAYKIFDASQYLTSILCEAYPNPFDWGFDMIVSTLHKNYPGPQKGMFAVKNTEDVVWDRYVKNAKTFISNTHPKSIIDSIRPQLNIEALASYNERTTSCILGLEKSLYDNGVPVIRRSSSIIPTQHLWIQCPSPESNYEYYLNLENVGLLTNYRLLPYKIGFGLRIGLSAAVLTGLNESHIEELSEIMSTIYKVGLSDVTEKRTLEFIKRVKSH